MLRYSNGTDKKIAPTIVIMKKQTGTLHYGCGWCWQTGQ